MVSRVSRPVPLAKGPQDIASILDRPLAEQPTADALADTHRRYTFAELDRALDAAAVRLSGLGVRSGDRVACSVPNGCDIVIAFLATQRLGAIWVGLNRALPVRERVKLLGHSESFVVLGDQAVIRDVADCRHELPALQHLIQIDGDENWFGGARESFSRPEIDPDAPAAIMYTSGTTGPPKGVMHSQHSLLTPVAAASAHGLWGATLRRGVVLPLTITNVIVIAPMLALYNGATCVCAASYKADEFVSWLDEEAIEVISTVPTIAYDLVHFARVPASLKVLLTGGAPLPLPIAQAVIRRFGFPPTNTYGLTEAPTIVTDTRGHLAPEGSSGKAAPHIALSIRDPDGRVLNCGEVGEICLEAVDHGPWKGVYSPLVGYWKDSERTLALRETGWLTTGDMGRLDEEGWLYVVDRKSDMVLRGGSNIYPQEIIKVLEEDFRVAACAVVGVPDTRLGERTAAFIQPSAGTTPDDRLFEELKEACKTALASYKCPDFWFEIEEMPRNPGGKIVLPTLRQRAVELVTQEREVR